MSSPAWVPTSRRPRISIRSHHRQFRRVGALLALLGLAAVLIAAWRWSDAVWIRLLIPAALGLAVWRPWDGLLVLAGLGPVVGVFGAVAGSPISLRELLVVAVFAGWALRGTIAPSRQALLPPGLRWPLTAAAAIVTTSFVVELGAQRLLIGPAAFEATLRYVAEFGFLRERHAVRGLNAAVIHLEGLTIFAAAVALTSRRQHAIGQAVAMAVAGATGAALLNIQRIVVAAQRAEAPLERLRELVMTARVNVSYTDVNAAGSYFALLLFPAVVLALRPSWRRHVVWLAAACAIFAAAWLTGSRTAVAAILGVSIGATAVSARAGAWRARSVAAAAVVCLLAAGAFLLLFPNRILGGNAPVALEIRLLMARVTFQMLAAEPLFGAGVGGYAEASEPLLVSSVLAEYRRENAHNQLLQWLGELGLVGLAALMWLLWSSIRHIRAGLALPDPMIRKGLVAGLIAFALTTLAGHPLLTADVNHAFWMLLGLAAATVPPQTAVLETGRARVAALGVAALSCLLLPWRVSVESARLPLEHVRHGVSPWEVDADGVRYQTFSERVTLFVPSTARAVDIPLRLADGQPPAVLEIRFRDRLADRVTVVPGAWLTYRLMVGSGRSDPAFLLVHIRPVDAGVRQVHIGRTVLR